VAEFRTIYPDQQSPGGAYHLLNAVIAPRPIAWVSSVSPDGSLNLAPHSYTTVVSPSPPMVCFVSIGRKDTLNNVEATRVFVYNIGGRALVERINRTAANFPPEISEFDWAGLTPVPGERVSVPRVAEAAVQMEATVADIIRIGRTDNHLVIGEIVAFHIAEEIMRDSRVDTALLNPVGRLAGADYAAMGEVFRLERPTWQSLQDSDSEPMPRLGDG
jgi:flavin reductase (DIM6/NTAB) family NADH-FMN oxidoreductase RutF